MPIARFKQIIFESGFTQKQIVKDMNMYQSRLSGIVNGKIYPSPDEYYRLAKYLGVTMEECYKWEE